MPPRERMVLVSAFDDAVRARGDVPADQDAASPWVGEADDDDHPHQQQEEEDKFHFFARLPPEIRHQIWEHAVPRRSVVLEDVVEGGLPAWSSAWPGQVLDSLLWLSDLRNVSAEARYVVDGPRRGRTAGDAAEGGVLVVLPPTDVLHHMRCDACCASRWAREHDEGAARALGVYALALDPECLEERDMRWLGRDRRLRRIDLVVSYVLIRVVVLSRPPLAPRDLCRQGGALPRMPTAGSGEPICFKVLVGLYDTWRIQELLSLTEADAGAVFAAHFVSRPLCLACKRRRWRERAWSNFRPAMVQRLQELSWPTIEFQILVSFVEPQRPQKGFVTWNLGF